MYVGAKIKAITILGSLALGLWVGQASAGSRGGQRRLSGTAWLWRGPRGGVPSRRGPCHRQLPGWQPPGRTPVQHPVQAGDTGQSSPCRGRAAPVPKVSGSTSALSFQSLGEKQIRKPFPKIASRERETSGPLRVCTAPWVAAQGGLLGTIRLAWMVLRPRQTKPAVPPVGPSSWG